MKVAVIDDNALFRKAFCNYILYIGYQVVGEYESGLHFRDALEANNIPDVVLVDVGLPENDACKTTLWLGEHYPNISVMAMGMSVNKSEIINTIISGAKDYITQDILPTQLKYRLDSLLNE